MCSLVITGPSVTSFARASFHLSSLFSSLSGSTVSSSSYLHLSVLVYMAQEFQTMGMPLPFPKQSL